MEFSYSPITGPHPLASGYVCGLPNWLASSASPDVDLRRFMEAYPHAAGYMMVLAEPDTQLPRFDLDQFTGRVDLMMHWNAGERATEKQRLERLAEIMTSYKGIQFLRPTVAGYDRPLHPLLAWWAVLFCLSMLARYQPGEWVSHIDVNTSPYAVALETLSLMRSSSCHSWLPPRSQIWRLARPPWDSRSARPSLASDAEASALQEDG
jgi:hypothetical protein